MYSLSNYIPYQGNEDKVVDGRHKCLLWSVKTGYYFSCFGFHLGHTIIAIEEK